MTTETTQQTVAIDGVDYVMVNGVPLPSRRTRKGVVVYTLIICTAIIAYILGFGNDENSLHQSALAWTYSMYIVVVMAYVFGAVADTVNIMKARK